MSWYNANIGVNIQRSILISTKLIISSTLNIVALEKLLNQTDHHLSLTNRIPKNPS